MNGQGRSDRISEPKRGYSLEGFLTRPQAGRGYSRELSCLRKDFTLVEMHSYWRSSKNDLNRNECYGFLFDLKDSKIIKNSTANSKQ